MGLVKLRAIERSCKMILMCMADNGNDQGENIYRSMEYLARESCCHPRTVQKKIGQMLRIGLLVDVGRKTYGRGHLRSFELDLDALLTLFPNCHDVAEDVDPAALAGLIEDSEKEARAAGWLPEEEREDQQEARRPAGPTGTEDHPEKGGAGPPFSEGEKGGAEEQKGGAESTKGWPQRPPEPLRTVIEPNSARAGAPDGDPGGPSGEPEPADPNERHSPPEPPGADSEPAAAGEPGLQGDQEAHGSSPRTGSGSGATGTENEPGRLFENRHWKPARALFVQRFGEAFARTWWDPLIALRHEADGTLVLDVPSQVQLEMIRQRYAQTMERALRETVAAAAPDGANGALRFVVEGLAARAEASRKAKLQEVRGSSPRTGSGTKRARR